VSLGWWIFKVGRVRKFGDLPTDFPMVSLQFLAELRKMNENDDKPIVGGFP
jgi:hypothetical protein